MGIAEFNEACRESVLRYTDEWREYVTRQARWVDFDNDYKTLDPSFMESVIWAFKQLWDKGLAYEGYRVLPYCWRDETPLSNHELRMDDDIYQSRQDPAITVGFKIAGGGGHEELAGAFLLVWTTTPWTLPSNQAVAVNPDVEYVLVRSPRSRRYLLAAGRVAAYARELGEEPEILATYRGADLRRVCAICRRSRISWTPPTAFRCCLRTSSASRTVPASCTCRRRTAKTTWRRLPRPGSCRSRRSTRRAGSTRPFPTTRISMSSTPTRRSFVT